MADLLAVVIVIACAVAGAELVRALCRRQLLQPVRLDPRAIEAPSGGVRETA